KMKGLDAALEDRLLGLDEIADPNVLLEDRSGAQSRKGTDSGAFADPRSLDVAVRADDRQRGDLGVGNPGEREDFASGRDRRLALEHHEGMQDRVRLESDLGPNA